MYKKDIQYFALYFILKFTAMPPLLLSYLTGICYQRRMLMDIKKAPEMIRDSSSLITTY